MKHKILIGLLILLSGCLPNKKPDAKIPKSDSSLVQIEYSPPTQLIEDALIPEGFKVDNIEDIDKANNISYLMEIPTTDFPGFQEFLNPRISILKKEMQVRTGKRKSKMKKALADDPAQLSRMYSFDFYPQSIYQDSTCISMRFWGTWYEGGPHGLPEYYTFNFDKETGSEINFEDYFQLTSAQDSQILVDLVNEGLQNPNLSFDEIYPIKFNIEEDSVSFNFDAYDLEAYAYGMPRAYVSKLKLGSLVNEKYR